MPSHFADCALLIHEVGRREDQRPPPSHEPAADVESTAMDGAHVLNVELHGADPLLERREVRDEADGEVEQAGHDDAVHGLRAESASVVRLRRVDDQTHQRRVREVHAGAQITHRGKHVPAIFYSLPLVR